MLQIILFCDDVLYSIAIVNYDYRRKIKNRKEKKGQTDCTNKPVGKQFPNLGPFEI